MGLKREGPTYLGISWVRLLRIQSFGNVLLLCARVPAQEDWKGHVSFALGGDLEPGTAVGAGLERQLHNAWRTDTSCGFHLGKPGVPILRHTGTDKHIHEHPFYERNKCSVKRMKHHPKVHCAQHIPTCPLPGPGKAASRGSE